MTSVYDRTVATLQLAERRSREVVDPWQAQEILAAVANVYDVWGADWNDMGPWSGQACGDFASGQGGMSRYLFGMYCDTWRIKVGEALTELGEALPEVAETVVALNQQLGTVNTAGDDTFSITPKNWWENAPDWMKALLLAAGAAVIVKKL